MEANHFNDYISKPKIALNVVLTAVFFAVFTYLLIPYVPAQAPLWQIVWAAFTSAAISGVFFIALFMFQLVLAENLRAKR